MCPPLCPAVGACHRRRDEQHLYFLDGVCAAVETDRPLLDIQSIAMPCQPYDHQWWVRRQYSFIRPGVHYYTAGKI
jgi:hypothetical protein